jgi:hypothetical protein
VCFSVGTSGVTGVVDLASARVAHVYHPPGGGARLEQAQQASAGGRQRLGWMPLWGRESGVVCIQAPCDTGLVVLRRPRGERCSRLAWGEAAALEASSVRCVMCLNASLPHCGEASSVRFGMSLTAPMSRNVIDVHNRRWI